MAEPLSHIHAPGRRDTALRLHMPEPEEDGQELAADPRRYRAVETVMKPARLIIHPRTGPMRMPGYATLIDVIATQCGTGLTLIYAHLAVEIIGRNLLPVAMAVGRHRAATITDYDPEAFDPPALDAPLIERIEVEAGVMMGEQIERVTAGRSV